MTHIDEKQFFLNKFILTFCFSESFWDSNAFETDTDLPSGWMRVRDTSGTYYWHIPTGTTQWEPPSPLGKVGDSMMSSTMSLETTPCEEADVSLAAGFSCHFMQVRKHWLLLLNFPGVLGSTFQHWWGSWWIGPVEGKYSGFSSCVILI